tara:strand:+ start:36 stop:287 length:252 start_codon:yes stop_codon:yes gene_type:complete
VRIYLGRESTERKEALGRKSRQNNQPGILGGREGRPRRARPLGGKRTKTPKLKLSGEESKSGKVEMAKVRSGKVPEPRKSFRG